MNMSLDEYLRLTDDDFNQFIAYEQGYVVNNPYTESCLLDLTEGDVDEVDADEDNDLFESDEIEDMLQSDSFGEI